MGFKDKLNQITRQNEKATGHYNIKINPKKQTYTMNYSVPIPASWKGKIAHYLFDLTEKRKKGKKLEKADIEKGLAELEKHKKSNKADDMINRFRSSFLKTIKKIEKDMQKNKDKNFKIYTYLIDDYDFKKKKRRYEIFLKITGDCRI